MTIYHFLVTLHLLAVSLWFGHMLFWSLFAGIALKKIQPMEKAERLRRLSLTMGGLGWPSLAVLFITGVLLLGERGVTASLFFSGLVFTAPGGLVLAAKLALVLWMVFYQARFGHKAAPRAVYVNMAAALAIVGLSILLVRPGLWQ